MKKILLGVGLLIALLAVSYVKTMRDREHDASARLEGLEVGRTTIELQEHQIESLRTLINTQEAAFDDSLAAHELQRTLFTDSLYSTIGNLRHELDSLRRIREAKPAKSTSTPAPAQKNGGAAHKDILAYYKQKTDQLPQDLSDYERRVAVTEVREETARKFDITVKRLNEIREQHQVEY